VRYVYGKEKEMQEKQSWKTLPFKDKLTYITAIGAFVVGWGLTIAGFIIPPLGEVADSTLWVLGQALIYCASVLGITGYFTSESRRMKREIQDFVNNRLEGESYHDSEG